MKRIIFLIILMGALAPCSLSADVDKYNATSWTSVDKFNSTSSANVDKVNGVTAAAVALLLDNFNGTDTEAPSSTYWNEIDSTGTFASGSYFYLHNNTLEWHAKRSSGTCAYILTSKDSFSTSAARSYSVTFSTLSSLVTNNYCCILIYNSANLSDMQAGSPKNAIRINIYYGNFETGYFNSSGTYTSTFGPNGRTLTGSHTLKITLNADGTYNAYWDGTALLSNQSMTSTSMGSTIGCGMYIQTANSASFGTVNATEASMY